jgi:hypothetical protein
MNNYVDVDRNSLCATTERIRLLELQKQTPEHRMGI